MKTEANFIDYGIYIDRKRSFIISLNYIVHEAFMEEETEVNPGELPRSTKVNGQQEHLQNDRNEQLKKFCKAIIAKLDNAHSILIFGPSVSKFELQKEVRESKHLKHVAEELLVTDVMEKEEAIRFVTDHFTPITVGQLVFTAAKKA